MADTSSRLTTDSGCLRFTIRPTTFTNITNGYMSTISTRMVRTVKPNSCFQCVEPMVFGIISEKMRINRVVTPDTTPNHASPNTTLVCKPTPAAPMVLAIVFNERMAASGFSGSVLYFLINEAFLSPSSSFAMM